MLSLARALAAAVVAATVLAPGAGAEEPTHYRCGEDFPGSPAVYRPSFAVTSGPLAVWSRDGDFPLRPLDHYQGWYHWEVNVSLLAEHRATIGLRSADVRRVALGGHSSPNSLAQGYRRVRFTACRLRDHRKTSGWVWVLITRAKTTCLHLRARIDGGRTRTVTLPLGRRC